MNPIFKKVIVYIIIAIILTVALSWVEVALMPVLTNDMALGQLDNDDAAFIAWESWTRLQVAFDYIRIGIWAACGFSVGTQIYKHYKKENIINEEH